MSHRALSGGLVALALVLSACTSNDSKPSSRGSAAPSAAGPAIKITSIVDAEGPGFKATQGFTGAQAAVKAINAAGGVAGRRLELITCNAKADPNETAKCGREANDNGSVAVVGPVSSTGTLGALLAKNSMASIGGYASGADLGSPVGFPLTAVPTVAGCTASVLADQAGAKRITLAYTDIPVAAAAVDLVKAVAAIHGATLRAVPVPPGKPDLSAEVRAASRDTDGVAVLLSSGDIPRFLQASKQAGVTVPIATQGLSEDVLQKTGPSAEGTYVCGYFRPIAAGGTGVQQFVKEMDAVDSSAIKDDTAVAAWLSVHMFADVAMSLPTVDKASVLSAFGKLDQQNGYGFIPPYTTTKAPTALGGKLPRLFNTAAFPSQYKNGKLTPVTGDFTYPFEPAKK